MIPEIFNTKIKFAFLLLLFGLLFLIPLHYIKADRVTMDSSAHDLSGESTSVSCLNCHWMHQNAGANAGGSMHALINSQTEKVCFVCHSGFDPNDPANSAAVADLVPGIDKKPLFVRDKTGGGFETVHFPGQRGINIYNIKSEYDTGAAAGLNGSYHMFYGTTGEAVNDKNVFNCFDCHNHGVYDTTGTFDSTGGRFPKLLWSKGSYDSFYDSFAGAMGIKKSNRKILNRYYATEFYCLSCHSGYGYPKKLNGLPWDSARIQLDAVTFESTKHSTLGRYGTTGLPGVPELRNPYGQSKDISCLVCHNRHASAFPKLMRGNYSQNDMCLKCHYGATPARDTTYEFTYRNETTGQVNYITTGHIADKADFATLGHGRDTTSGGPGLLCSNCHGVHGTGHYKMVKVSNIVDPRYNTTDTITIYDTPYTLNAQQLADLDSSQLISGFCGGACHKYQSPDNYETWMATTMTSSKRSLMSSYYRGKSKFDSSKHQGVYNLNYAQNFSNYQLKDCGACHDSHGTQNKALLWGSGEELCFQCHGDTTSNDTTMWGAPNIERFFNTTKGGKSHHPVKAAEQTSTKAVECVNCHNPHIANLQNKTVYPYDWAIPSDSAIRLNSYGTLGQKDHETRSQFCASCHATAFPLTFNVIADTASTVACYPPGVKIAGTMGRIGDEWFAKSGLAGASTLVVSGSSGHFKSGAALIDCVSCHSPHGSNNPNHIRDGIYVDPVDFDTDYFTTGVYTNFTAAGYDSFYNENTKMSRKFCYSPDGSYGCHTPQYLTTRVTFPDALDVDTSHHNARKVPYGPLGTSYYIDEHNPYYDTNSATPPSGIVGCSVCHYAAHNPTPNYWYNNSAKSLAQDCLNCHQPARTDTAYFNTTAKFYGGAPTNYESPYVDFVSTSTYPLSTTYISKHLQTGVGVNATTTGYCKKCHGEHYNTSGSMRTDQYHDIPGSFISSPDTSLGGGLYATEYLKGTSFCLGCHRAGAPAIFGTRAAPNINLTYATAGHGRLGRGNTSPSDKTNGIQVYCFDCHTKHSSQNPYLLRTKIRDLITYSTVTGLWDTIVSNRDIRAENLDTGFRYASVKVDGYQYICFACHSQPGSSYDSGITPQIDGISPNPGTALWLGQAVYESAGHGNTWVPPYRDTTYGTTANGLTCSWCHEPHGREVDSTNTTQYGWNTAYITAYSSYTNNMLKMNGDYLLCFKCHNQVLNDTVNNVTIANIKVLFDSSLSIHNIYSTTSDTRITCLNCHNPHTGNKLYPVVVPDKRTTMNPGDDAFCLGCHRPTAEVPTFPSSPLPNVVFPTRSATGEAYTGWDKTDYTTSAHGEYGVWCRTCHKPHGTNKTKLLREVFDFNQDNNLGGHNYDSIYNTVVYGSTDTRDEDVCFGCHRNHTGESDWNTAWTNIPDILQYYKNYNSTTRVYSGYTMSHHRVFSFEQIGKDTTWGTDDDMKIECHNCHNQHKASADKPVTDPDNPTQTMSAWGDEGISFCLRCHDNDPPPGVTGLSDAKFRNIKTEYGAPDINGIYPNFSGHYRQIDGKPLECRMCHNMHGSNFAKQIQDATDSTYDTFKMIRNMRPVALDSALDNPATHLSGYDSSDTLALSSLAEICLSCHSGKTQFYDRSNLVWRDIPLPPPTGYLDPLDTSRLHPNVADMSKTYSTYADTGLVRKKVISLYSSVFNIVDSTLDTAGCSCHGAHNPYKEHTNEFSNCYNCHNALSGIPDQKTPFDTGKFLGANSPLVKDDNTLLLLHLDGNYVGASNEQPLSYTGLSYVAGQSGFGQAVSFDTTWETTQLAYPLWTRKTNGATSEFGIAHDSTTDLTIRFNNDANDEDNGKGRYLSSLSSASGVTYVEGYIPGITGAAYLGGTASLIYYSTASAAVALPPRTNINIAEGSFEAWVNIGEAGTGIQDTTADRYIFWHATNAVEPFVNTIFLRHSYLNTWDICVSDEIGKEFNIVSVKDELTYGWHHIAATWSKSDKQLKIYLDGVLAASESAMFFPFSTSSTFRIGSSSLSGTSINTSIDEAQVSNYKKTDAEILDDYNCQNKMSFSARRGTLEFWLKPYWDGNDGINHCFFESYYNTNNYFRFEKDGTNKLKFTIKGRDSTYVLTGISSSVDAVSLPKDTWSHVAVSWEDFGTTMSVMNLYLNTTKVASTNAATAMMGYIDTAIYFGSRKDKTYPARVIMDEIWITNIMQSDKDIVNHALGYSNVPTASTTSPATSYLSDPNSLGLILHYDSSYNGEKGETPRYSNVSLVSGKFTNGALVTGSGYLNYLAGDGYNELSSTAAFTVNNFNSTFGNASETSGVTFTSGFLGSGAVLVDSSDTLSYKMGLPTNNLVAYWKMNENALSTIYDSATADGAQNGTITGASWVNGKSGTGLNFNGSAQYVDCGTPANFDFGAGNFTVSGWIKPTTLKNYAGIVSKVVPNRGGTYSWMFVSHNDGRIGFYTPATNWQWSNTAGVITAGNWYHVTWVRNGTNLYFYINGAPYGSYASFSYTDVTTHNVFLGSWYSPNTLYDFNGVIDEVAIYNRALDSSEVDLLYKYSNDNNVTTGGTIQTWALINSAIKDTSTTRYIFRTTTDTATSKDQIALYHDTNNNWVFHTSDSTGTNYTSASVPDNISYGWHNFAATWNTSSVRLYIDGRLEKSVANPKLPNNVASKYYLGSGGQNNTHINTALDEFLFDNTAKSASAILANITPVSYNYNVASGTIEMWMKPVGWNGTDTTNKHYLFDAYINDLSKNRISLYYDTTKEMKFEVYDSTGFLRRAKFDVSALLDTTTFRHYAGTWDPYSVYLYIDGVEKDSTKSSGNLIDKRSAGLFIGSNGALSSQANAIIDEVRIFDTIRIPDAIMADAGDLLDYKKYFADSFNPYDGGSRHPINMDPDAYNSIYTSTGVHDISKMECLKCHLQLDSSTIYHRGGVVEFVDVDSDTSWTSRKKSPIAPDNSTKRNVTLFCLSCHMNPKADPLDAQYFGSTSASPYRFTGSAPIYGGNPVQLKGLVGDLPVMKPDSSGYYYPLDTGSAHFDTSFGPSAFGGLSCTDCHDPHGSINKTMLQDFEEAKEKRDYNRDGVMTREIQYFDKENVKLYQLNEEKFCFFCHNGKFNTTGVNRGWQMKNIEAKFANKGAHHMVDDDEQAKNDVRIECTNCHNPHTVKRDAVVLNPQTGQRDYVTATDQMNNFCEGCHGSTTISPALPTTWDEGVKFPGSLVNTLDTEWIGNSWNKFNKASMKTGNKHFAKVECAACHDPHGTSNYRMLNETVMNKYPEVGGNPSSPSTTYVYGLKLMLQRKPDGRDRYEVYSTVNPYTSAATNYSINQFCFSCHVNAKGYDPDYPSVSVYPGKNAYNLWDFGTTSSASTTLVKYDTFSAGGYTFTNPDVYGKDKDCDYCHNPHSSDSVRVHMVRDSVPQDLDRNSPNFGDRIDSANWFQDGFPATGIDFCLSKGCHVSNRFAKLGPRDPNYSDPSMKWWYKPYDQFDLMDYGQPNALQFSTMRPDSFFPNGIEYTTARASKHPIVAYDKFINGGNTLICISCHAPHGSPGNTELAASYGSYYESTYPQDNAGLRRAYYRRIYWWPVTFWKRGDPSQVARNHNRPGSNPSNNQFANFTYTDPDNNGNTQNYRYFSVFHTGNTLQYTSKVQQSVPSGANDICFMCHTKGDIIGDTTVGIGIDSTKTRFIGHEAVVGGSKIGGTRYPGSMLGVGLNKLSTNVPNDFHQFTCSTCHGPHASTNEKLITNKCYAFNFVKPPQGDPNDSPGRTSRFCHPFDNTGSTNWGTDYNGWRRMIDTTKTDMIRPQNSIDSLYIYFNTTGKYDTSVAIPGLDSLYVTCSDFDVVLAWKSVYDSTQWVDHYNIYRGETTLTQLDKAYASRSIKTWAAWGYSLINKIYDTGSLYRPKEQVDTLYTIDPSFAHILGKRYFYMVVPADIFDNEAITPNCQHDTTGVYVYYSTTNTVTPRPITAMAIAQETYDTGGPGFRMRISWQDPGDNIATNRYALYYALMDTGTYASLPYSSLGAYLTSRVGGINDTSYNTDIISAINYGDYYGTTHETSALNYASTGDSTMYIFGIKSVDYQNNTAAFSLKAIRIADLVPSLITNLAARPDMVTNLSDSVNSMYNVALSWTVPWDNAQPAESIPIYKVYRRLNNPVRQTDINTYNLVDTALTDVVCLTTLTSYNSIPLAAYGLGSTIIYTDNVAPNNVYYYAVTSIDKYATMASSLADTVYGYSTDRAGRLYREQMQAGYNTKLLSPISGQMSPKKTNAHFSFSFPAADYDTAYFKEYRFYERYATDKAWQFRSTYVNSQLMHGGTGCLNAGCHDYNASGHYGTDCVACHPGNARGGLDIDTSAPSGNYYFAGSIVYNSVRVIIDGRTSWVNNVQSPLNDLTMLNVADLFPPWPLSVSIALVPAKENGYDSIRLSWSGGQDTNFKDYEIRSRSVTYPTDATHNSSAWVSQAVINTMSTSTWVVAYNTPDYFWQTTYNTFGDFAYIYELQAWDSADNYSSVSIPMTTRPPSGRPNFGFAGANSTEIRLQWNNLYNNSYGKDYIGATGYNIYAKETTGTIDHVFQTGTINIDTAYGIYKIGTVPAIADTTSYPQTNQALNVAVSASSSLIPASNANDGNLATYWMAMDYDTFSTTWIEFDLGTTKALASIVYNNSFDSADPYYNALDSTQGYTILTADTSRVWDTLVTQPISALRGESQWIRPVRTPIQYIRVTGFSHYGTTGMAGEVTELGAYYPMDSSVTSFSHTYNNSQLRAQAGHSYAYGIYLEDSTGAKSRTSFAGPYLVIDNQKPNPVIDLVAYGVSYDTSIRLKWSKPTDNVGVVRYEIWRRENNPDIVDSVFANGTNKRLSSTVVVENYIDTATNASYTFPYYYAVCAVDSTGNRSDFAGKNYSAYAYVGKNKDTTPPEPITLLTISYPVKGSGRYIHLAWDSSGNDKKDFDSAGNVDNTLYHDATTGVLIYSIFKQDYATDSSLFLNKLAQLNRSNFDSAGTTGVAYGWSAGTWGGTYAPSLVTSIDSSLASPAQKLYIYNYTGNPDERISTNPNYMRSAAYIKTTGYVFDTSASLASGMETATTHYIFGIWLKAEGQLTSTYTGNVYIDIDTNLVSGNESTYGIIARRTLINPSRNWTYYILNFATPTGGLSDSSNNGIMIWANNEGKIWMDSAKLVYLGKPKIRPTIPYTDDYDIIVNHTYGYAVTAVDRSSDSNPYDGFTSNGNEGDFVNFGNISCDEMGDIFDTVFDSIYDSAPWLLPSARTPKTGTTPTMSFVEGATPEFYTSVQFGSYGNHLYDSDNMFRNGDFITLKFRVKDPYTGQPDSTVLDPGYGDIQGDFTQLDTGGGTFLSKQNLGNGYYSFSYRITTNTVLTQMGLIQKPDTPYNTSTGMYESLYRVRVGVIDKAGNGPTFFPDTDNDPSDNNPDTTYRLILDNETPNSPY